jgi:hypothetical protein
MMFLLGCSDLVGNWWDGGQYAGQSVFSTESGPTKEAHQELKECGLSDDAPRNIDWSQISQGTGTLVSEEGKTVVTFDGLNPLFILTEENVTYGLGESVYGTNKYRIIVVEKKGEDEHVVGILEATPLSVEVKELICNP